MGLRKSKMINLPFEMGDAVKAKDGRTGEVRLNYLTRKSSLVLFADKTAAEIPWEKLKKT